ncbi:hypothetical protein A2U01_0102041, partial [Trifolium medium]|nr:hypothetical protein [Trifolium medium]
GGDERSVARELARWSSRLPWPVIFLPVSAFVRRSSGTRVVIWS